MVACALLAEFEELVVCSHHSHVEICILQIHTGHPLMWAHDNYDGVQSFHLADIKVEELQIQDETVAAVLLGYQEIGAIVFTPHLV